MSIYKIDQTKIENRITEFESHVDFELVPVITSKSSQVESIGLIIILFLMLLFFVFTEFLLSNSWESKTGYLGLSFLLALVFGAFLTRFDFVLRFFISKKERTRQVIQKSQRIFFLKHLFDLQKANSIILFISILEKKIVVLPDPRLKIDNLEAIQQSLIAQLSSEFKKGDYEAGFLKAIAYLENVLKDQFPKTTINSENQVSNKLIWWND